LCDHLIDLLQIQHQSIGFDEKEWEKAAASNPAFAFLHDGKEDIYYEEDGKALNEG
jgi:hypothetical protein